MPRFITNIFCLLKIFSLSFFIVEVAWNDEGITRNMYLLQKSFSFFLLQLMTTIKQPRIKHCWPLLWLTFALEMFLSLRRGVASKGFITFWLSFVSVCRPFHKHISIFLLGRVYYNQFVSHKFSQTNELIFYFLIYW